MVCRSRSGCLREEGDYYWFTGPWKGVSGAGRARREPSVMTGFLNACRGRKGRSRGAGL